MRICRGILILVVALYFYVAGILILLYVPHFLIVAAAAYSCLKGRKIVRRFTTLGSARYAEPEELEQAGWFNAQEGPVVGVVERIRKTKKDLGAAIGLLLNKRVPSDEACQGFMRACGWGRDRPYLSVVRIPKALAVSVFAPSGAGKSTGMVMPFLRVCRDSVIAVDMKGELALETAAWRRSMGQEVILLDPFKLVAESKLPFPSACFNPLAQIDPQAPDALDCCRDIGESVIEERPNEHQPHFPQMAKIVVSGVAAAVVLHGENKSLKAVTSVISNPAKFDAVRDKMMGASDWEGALADMGGQMKGMGTEEKGGVMTTCARNLGFTLTPMIAQSLSKSTYDPLLLKQRPMTIYLILPMEHKKALAPLLRLWISSHLRAVMRGNPSENQKVHFVIDEAAALGAMPAVEEAINIGRGYGLRMQFYYQSMGQLKMVYPADQGQTLLSNTTQVFFGTNDLDTASYISTRLGDFTEIVESGGTNEQEGGSDGTSIDSMGRKTTNLGTSWSQTTNSNWGQQARRLAKVEEVLTWSERNVVIFAKGMRPVWTYLMRYYEAPGLFVPQMKPREKGDGLFVKAVLNLLLILCGAVFVTMALSMMGIGGGFAAFQKSQATVPAWQPELWNP
jgi:type IV secretion system protein VirD4